MPGNFLDPDSEPQPAHFVTPDIEERAKEIVERRWENQDIYTPTEMDVDWAIKQEANGYWSTD